MAKRGKHLVSSKGNPYSFKSSKKTMKAITTQKSHRGYNVKVTGAPEYAVSRLTGRYSDRVVGKKNVTVTPGLKTARLASHFVPGGGVLRGASYLVKPPLRTKTVDFDTMHAKYGGDFHKSHKSYRATKATGSR